MDLQGVLAGVCALSCVCVGLLLIIALFVLRIVGGQFLGTVWDTLGGFLGGGSGGDEVDTTSRPVDTRRTAGTGGNLRQRAQSLDFDDALRRQGGAIQSQAAAPRATGTLPAQTGGFQSQAAPLQSRTGLSPQTGGFQSQNAPLQSGGFQNQNVPVQPRGNLPQPPAFPPPPAAGQPGLTARPNFTPLNPNARRPSLSQGRTLSQNTPSPSPSLRSGLEGEELPGLRSRRERRGGEEDIYDDQDGGMLDGLL